MPNKTMMDQVTEMHDHFGLYTTLRPLPLSAEEKVFRIKCLREEVQEFEDAHTLADQLDALVDLTVFTLGTADRLGMADVFETAFARVMKANMQKEVARTAEDSKRGFKTDLVKPAGWTAPDLTDLVGEKP